MSNIRVVASSDIPMLAKVFVDTYDRFDVGERWTLVSAHALLSYWLDRQPDLAFLVKENDEIMGGFFAAIKPWWDGNHLVDGEIFTHPDCQGLGIGSALMKRMFEQAIERYDVKVWDMYTFRNTKHPLSWYEKLGFYEIKDWVMMTGDVRVALSKLA